MIVFVFGNLWVTAFLTLYAFQLITLTHTEIPLSVWISLSNVTSTEFFINRFLRDKPSVDEDDANGPRAETKLPISRPKLLFEPQQQQQQQRLQHKPPHSPVKYPFWNTPPIYAGAGNFFPADSGSWAFDSNSNSIYEQTESLGSGEGLAEHIGIGIQTQVLSEQKVQRQLAPLSKHTQALVMSSLATPSAGCRPSPTCVTLTPPNRDPDVIYWPITTEVDRCAGCCNHEALHCIAKDWQLEKIKVIKARYANDNRDFFIFEGNVDLEVVKHTKCVCECKVKASACNQNQIYAPDKCACEKKREKAAGKKLSEIFQSRSSSWDGS